MIISQERGWKIIWKKDKWVYQDTGEPITGQRRCRRCSQLPTPEGYDACKGYIKDVSSVCCGHGVSKEILQ